MTKLDIFSGIFSLSGCFFILYGLHVVTRVTLFINKRYEETNLSQTRYFKEKAPWAEYFPAFLRSAIYSAHLWKFVVYWNKDRFEEKKKGGKGEIIYYADIKSPEQVTSHFSKKEIKLVKRSVYVYLIVGLHMAAYGIFKIIFPEMF